MSQEEHHHKQLSEDDHVCTEGILVGHKPSGARIWKLVRHYRCVAVVRMHTCKNMIVSVRPVGNVATDDTSCRHGKDPSDAHRAGVTTPQRPTNDIKADFYPARQCSLERPDGGKRASPNDAINATERGGGAGRATGMAATAESAGEHVTIGLMGQSDTTHGWRWCCW